MPFKKGESGNPNGRKPLKKLEAFDLAQVCRIHSREMVELVAQLAQSDETPPAQRLKAIEMLWDRGYGKAVQPIDATLRDKRPNEMTDDELAAEAAKLRAALGLVGDQRGRIAPTPGAQTLN